MHRQIASERMLILLDLAVKSLKKDDQQAQHYLVHARKLGMRYKVRIPAQFRQVVCRHCKKLIVPGVNARVRISQCREPHVVISCIPCGGYSRIPLKRRVEDVH